MVIRGIHLHKIGLLVKSKVEVCGERKGVINTTTKKHIHTCKIKEHMRGNFIPKSFRIPHKAICQDDKVIKGTR